LKVKGVFMKPLIGLAALLAWLSHCPNIDLHPPHHPDAGQPSEDAGPPDVTSDDASVSADDAALGGGDAGATNDAGMPPVIEDAAVGTDDLDASLIDPPDAIIVEEPSPPVSVPAGQCNTGDLGLYQPGYCDEQHLADGILKYKPQFELWSDGAIKDRYIWLPPGSYIDTTDPDRWAFPQGTKLWKAFTVQGKRIETRLLTKVGADNLWTSWTAVAYAWSENQSVAAPAAADGIADALGTEHDIPKQTQCTSCHNMAMRDGVNGFGAIQLNYEPPPDPSGLELVTLRYLIFRGLLRNGDAGLQNVYADQARLPGDATTQAALGYLHANCGNCHGGPMPKRGMALWATVNTRNVTDMPAFKQTCGQCLAGWYAKPNNELADGSVYKHRLVPGAAAESGMIGRMSAHMVNTNIRVTGDQMPPMGTEFLDNAGLTRVRDWIDALAPDACPLVEVCNPPPPPMMAGAAGAAATAGAAGSVGTPRPAP
jgi:hypothetical protein